MSIDDCQYALSRFEYNKQNERVVFHICFCHIAGHMPCPYKQLYCIVKKEMDDIVDQINFRKQKTI